MRHSSPFGALLLVFLLLPTPALCALCAAEGCAMERAAEERPMEKAPEGCCAAMQARSHEAPMSHGTPADREMPTGHDCASQPMAAVAADDCCATSAGRDAETPAAPAPTSHGLTPVVPPSLSVAPALASNADGVRRAMPPPAASRALFTLHSILLI